MFGMKKKGKRPAAIAFTLFDEKNQACAQYDAAALPLNRDAVLEKSVEFFQDPNPCAIHEGAVRMRMLGELEAYLREQEAPVALAAMPEALRRYLDLPAACRSIRLSGACRETEHP